MPLADVSHLVARLAAPMGYCFLARRQRDAVTETAGLRGVLAGLEDGSGGPADGLRGKGILEPHAVGRHAVEVRRQRQFLAIAANRVPSLLIAKENDDVRPFAFPDGFSGGKEL